MLLIGRFLNELIHFRGMPLVWHLMGTAYKFDLRELFL